MDLKNGVINIQVAGYNDARMVLWPQDPVMGLG